MRKPVLAVVVVLMLAVVSLGHAQMQKNQLNLGLKVGYYWGIGVALGGEYVFMEIPKVGFIGAGGEIGFGGRKVTWPDYMGGEYGWSYTYVPIIVYGSFHYPFRSVPKLVPYAKLGFGVEIVSAKATGTYAGTWASSDGTGFAFFSQLGIRYAVLPMLWVVGAVGYPFYVMTGIDFTLNLGGH